MDRRSFLALTAALASAPLATASESPGMRVVVAGAGIVGASIAYALAKAGARVTVIDRAGPATHASRGTFAWINATWAKQPRHYHRLNQESVADWRALQQELDIPVTWRGSLEWFRSQGRQEKLSLQVEEQVRWGEPAQMVGAGEVAELEPSLRFPAGELAAFSPNDGAVDPVLATHRLLDAARSLGAELVFPCELQAVQLRGERLEAVQTSTGRYAADRLVLATGAEPDLPGRVAGIGIPQRSTAGVIALSAPMPPLLNGIVAAPGVHLHQRQDGRFVLGEQDGAPDSHEKRLAGRPNDFPSPHLAREHGERMLRAARAYLPDLADAKIEAAYIGWRPLPLDGHPVLGVNPARPDIYLAIMHSGVSLAPVVGQLVAVELTAATVLEKLAPYRPTREFRRIKRY